ncbi:MAG: glycosyltransferase family 2 protein [Candidatus Eisenbacteria bacterium]|jgi:hypothetical protein|nr:glycosyltransferase family 2 protein [Candidatus Eisenbacteria bacterium]
MSGIDVIIPSWDGRPLLQDCLRALAAQTLAPEEVIVVDNGSSDGTEDWLRATWPSVRLIRLEVNQGFAGAVQEGVESTASELVAILNNDARPHQAWLEASAAVFEEKAVGACASVILVPGGTVESAGLAMSIWGVGRRHMEGARPDDLPREPFEVFGASGGAAVFRREALIAAGGFDRSFFAQDEDIDLAFRVRNAGFICVVQPRAVVVHLGGQTLRRSPTLLLALAQRNLEWAFWSNTPWWWWPVFGVLHVGYQGASVIRHAVAGRGRTVLKAKWAAFAGPPSRLRRGRPLSGFSRRVAPWFFVAQRPWTRSKTAPP